jgi:enamine deaminase RidA (YjgF/YER057c/UK114 family)
MENQSRRGLLKNAAKAAAAVTAGAALAPAAKAQTAGKLEKKSVPPKTQNDKVPTTPGKKPLFSSIITYGNMVFLAGVGAHFKGTIEEHTKHVLDELEKNLIKAGSSMEKVLKVNVYLNDLKDYTAMNGVYATANWGDTPPVRTTISPAGGIPGDSLIEIDMIAYI